MRGKSFEYFVVVAYILFSVTMAAVIIVTVVVLSSNGEGAYGLFVVVPVVCVWIVVSAVVRKKHQQLKKTCAFYLGGYLSDEKFVNSANISPKLDSVFELFLEKIKSEEKMKQMSNTIHYLALQEQINPHFLYNTLEGIRGSALMAGVDEVASMVEYLAIYFRYTITQTQFLVTLEDEMENVEYYFAIQKFRFNDRINLKTEYNRHDYDAMLKYKVPKLILQPFIENAIMHGLKNNLEPGTITIALEQTQDRLLVRISDDGEGIGPQTLRQIREKLINTGLEYSGGNETGIAINNVNSRIKMLFGDDYGVKVSSVAGFGTDVYIDLPIITGNEVTIYEKGNNSI